MRTALLTFVPLVLASLAVAHCGGSTAVESTPGAGAVPTPVPPAMLDSGVQNPDATGKTTSSKIDLLLVVDNSTSMSAKAHSLAASVGTLLRKVAPGKDVHVGVIASSLGSFGGDVCPDSSGARNGLAHLRNVGPNGAAVPAAAQGFLAFGASSNIEALVTDTQSLVNGVGEDGCGLEAQLEATYRFLVQPDPWASVKLDAANQAQLVGVDDALLAQRKAFLRPDSLVAVVMVTDEDDSSADPLSVGGQGWAFEAWQFPGSPNFRVDGKSTTAPRATSICRTDPASPECTSCGFAATCNPGDALCQKIKVDPECQKTGGYYGADQDELNVRFQHMKQRFGIDPQYPLKRYVDGFTKQRAPKRDGEHIETPSANGSGRSIGPYVGTALCTNPLFAASLPASSSEELCDLPQGPRGKELVVFALIGGVPAGLTTGPDWTQILGADPDTFDATGIDPHMIQSITPRAGLAPPSIVIGDNGNDPISGREWDTGGNDLQYACTFPLPAPRTCNLACDCAADSGNPPLCGAAGGVQINGKAYPTVRELRVAKALGERGVVGSVCAGDAANGYAATMTLLADRMVPRLEK